MMEQFLAQGTFEHILISLHVAKAAATDFGSVYVPVLLLGMAPQSKP